MSSDALDDVDATSHFVDALSNLPPAALRTLRQTAGQPLGANLAAYDIFNAIWRPLRRKQPIPRLACWQVATLYPWHSQPKGHGSLGRAMRCAAARGKSGAGIQTRMTALLAATGRGLDARLMDAARILAHTRIPLDWPCLLEDLSNWYKPGRPVQTAWAHDFLND